MLLITGNGQTFLRAEDITDETYESILDVLDEEISRTDIVRHDPDTGRVLPPDALAVAARCVDRVRRAALAVGWSPICAERLAAQAGVLYGAILGEVAAERKGLR